MTKNNITELLAHGKKLLREKGISSSSLDCDLLMMNVCNFTKVQLFTETDYTLSDDQASKFFDMLLRRSKFEPIQYILNKCEFMSLDFYVDENILIPRPDTEILVEEAISVIKNNNCSNILEVGTGSGCIAISIAHYCNNVNVHAVDISENALSVAKRNALSNCVNVNFNLGDIFSSSQALHGELDLIISNPPYIKRDSIKHLPDNVKNYEPLLALDGGTDGLDFYKRIAKESIPFFKNRGFLLFEIGYEQSEDVSTILESNGYKNIETKKDLANLNRIVYGEYSKGFENRCLKD